MMKKRYLPLSLPALLAKHLMDFLSGMAKTPQNVIIRSQKLCQKRLNLLLLQLSPKNFSHSCTPATSYSSGTRDILQFIQAWHNLLPPPKEMFLKELRSCHLYLQMMFFRLGNLRRFFCSGRYSSDSDSHQPLPSR